MLHITVQMYSCNFSREFGWRDFWAGTPAATSNILLDRVRLQPSGASCGKPCWNQLQLWFKKLARNWMGDETVVTFIPYVEVTNNPLRMVTFHPEKVKPRCSMHICQAISV